MTKKLFAVSAVVLISWVSTNPLAACGDKNSNAARGIWRGGHGSIGKREAILIVNSPDVQAALPNMHLVRKDLKDAGFEPAWADRPEFAARLKEKKWDLIVAGGAEADLAAEVQGPNRVLLVDMGASKQQRNEARKKYSGAITNVATTSIVDDVADALEACLRAAKKQKSNKRG